jgi:hypothetical protein
LKIHQLILFLLCTSLTIAQENQSQFEEGRFIHFPKEDGFVIIDDDFEYFTNDGVSFERREHAYNLSTDRLLRFPHPKRTLFYHAGGGIVYEYLNDSLVRIDQSYQWNSRYGATPFVMNDTLFLHGGYGELDFSHNTIYFDEIRKGWFLYDLEIPEADKKRSVFAHYDSVQNRLSFLFYTRPIFELTAINLDNGSSSSIPFETIENPASFAYRNHDFSGETYNLLVDNRGSIFSFDLKNFKYFKNEFDQRVNNGRHFIDFNISTNKYLIHDIRYGKLELLPKEYFFGESTEIRSIEETSSSNHLIYIVLVFTLLAVLILRSRRTKYSNSLFDCIQKNKHSIKRKISTNQNIMLDLILDKHPNWISLPDLSADLYEAYSHDSKQKKIRKDLKEIEKVILQECKLSDKTNVFHFDQSPDDKRIKTIALA